MRFRLNCIALLGVGLLAWPALAQSPDKPADEAPAGDSATKQKLLDNFDTNKDGKLDRDEARVIGRALREGVDFGPGAGGPGQGGREGRPRPDGPPPRDGQGPEARRGRGGDGPPGDRGPRGPRRGEGRGPNARGPEGRGPDDRGPGARGSEGRGPEGRGRGGPDGPPRPPRPERLFNRFDENKDGSLSMDEFIELTEFVHEHFPPGPPPGMRDGRGRGFDGPPPRGEGRRRGDRRDGPPGPPAEDEGPKDPI
jgi:EF hand